jgi:hypothetical protein
MNTLADKFLNLPWLIAGIAAILLGLAAISALTASVGVPAESIGNIDAVGESPEAPAPGMREARARVKCDECGVIVSTREIETHSARTGSDVRPATVAAVPGDTRIQPTKIYITVVRFQNGSTLVLNDVNPARWRLGERVKVIGGAE